MVKRFILITLKEAASTHSIRAAIEALLASQVDASHSPLHWETLLPADEAAQKSWALQFVLGFRAASDAAEWSESARPFFESEIMPYAACVKAWNFEVVGERR